MFDNIISYMDLLLIKLKATSGKVRKFNFLGLARMLENDVSVVFCARYSECLKVDFHCRVICTCVRP